MIVLGPHIHHHNDHHDLVEGGGMNLASNSETPINREYNAFRRNSISGGDDEDGRRDHQQSPSAATPTPPKMAPLEATCINMLFAKRLEVSKLLGSIGAPPLFSPDNCGTNKNVRGANEESRAHHNSEEAMMIDTEKQHTKQGSVQIYLDSVVELATSHTELLQTIQSCLHMLTVGTGLRLGIGPNNIPASRRAERAWLERKVRSQNASKESMMKSYKPKMTLHRYRQILHHAIVDQTTSLQNIVAEHAVNFSGISGWDEFVHDLKHTVESNCVLTLSRLTKWTEHVGKYLGATLSELFSPSRLKFSLLEKAHYVGSETATIASSVQEARERIIFLQSAFSMPSSGATKSCEDDLTRACGREDGRDVNNVIDLLKSNLEGAHISLWAFEEAHSRSEESEPDWKDWLGKLHDLVERSYSTMSELDNLVLPRSTGDESGSTAIKPESNEIQDSIVTTPSAIHVSDEASVDEEVLHSTFETKQNVPLDKTLIFTGNGSHRRSQTSKNQAARSSSKSRNMPPPPSIYDQNVLLRDLQSRLKTMGLAEEYEVVAVTEPPDDAPTSTGSKMFRQSRQKNDLPMFLGVSGPALAELSSAMGRQREGQVIME